MNRLIRAEFLRISKTYHLLIWYIILFVFFAFVQVMDIGFDYGGNAIESYSLIEVEIPTFMSFSSFLIAGMFITGYTSKLLNYEIMAGESTHKLLLSKLITVAPLLTVVTILSCFVPVFYYGVRNGFGDGRYLAVRYAVMAVIFFRGICVSILMMTTFKSVIGVAMIFVRSLADVFYLLGLQLAAVHLSENAITKLMLCSPMSSVGSLGSIEISGSIWAVIVSVSVVEILIWYVLSYISYERKWFG